MISHFRSAYLWLCGYDVVLFCPVSFTFPIPFLSLSLSKLPVWQVPTIPTRSAANFGESRVCIINHVRKFVGRKAVLRTSCLPMTSFVPRYAKKIAPSRIISFSFSFSLNKTYTSLLVTLWNVSVLSLRFPFFSVWDFFYYVFVSNTRDIYLKKNCQCWLVKEIERRENPSLD